MTVYTPKRGETLVAIRGLREAITSVRQRESFARRAVLWLVGGWGLCPGCRQSCTGQYSNHLACTRCGLVLT